MTVNMYSDMHMENMLEIGRIIQHCLDNNKIEFYESKELFDDALRWAVEFEEHADSSEDYYIDIYNFTMKKLEEKFGDEWRA